MATNITNKLSLTHSHIDFLSKTYTHTHTHTLSLAHSHTLSLFLSYSLSLSHTYIYIYTKHESNDAVCKKDCMREMCGDKAKPVQCVDEVKLTTQSSEHAKNEKACVF